ncbi:Nucleotide-binding, alpha-beta plait [Penicillium expansum]|uniref:Nucleotide-binding, alpha-beta plait n=1 Tax=Penicillium expansum TaxID=27334 RepID=A0A0A2I5W4_PENEN|nr:Nucleotide-binding, alpha-beta plait [Penicillium expansum]KGO38497.1 Nucleotide-binding, alpha-beta plait [Penicillium expansum]KGO61801.1 Nucleotide-binding, alpha-beta plait [Penicillium expansum]KGO72727.1 Nucleotide-binding, alpha-beta plait [Penicillium expansum]
MPSLGRDKGRSRSRRSDDEFVIFLQGIPPHCRWQELKDLVRQTALHIRQAVVYDDSHGFPTGLGQIIVKNEDEAWRTYHRLSTSGWDGQSLVVTLSRTSTPTQPIAGPTRSPSMMPASYISGQSTPPLVHGNIAMPPSPVSPESSHPATPPYPYPEYGVMMVPIQIPQGYMPMMPDPHAQPMQCYPPSPVMNGTMYDPHWNMMPGYQMSPPHHMHHISGDNQPQNYSHYYPGAKATNSSSPYFSPDRRAITIENLNSTTTCADLKTLLQTAGTVQKCSIVATDSVDQSGQLRGLITMQTAEEAQGAVTMFNNLSFMGSRIRVKVDRGSHLARSVSFDGVCAGSDTAGSVPENGDTCQSWADEMTAEANAVDNCKPLVIDGSGLNRAGEGLSTSAPT